jgi:hypothetical protein
MRWNVEGEEVQCSECAHAFEVQRLDDPVALRRRLNEIRQECFGCNQQPPRFRQALVEKGKLDVVQDYLPTNYKAFEVPQGILIAGYDDHGWTLDGYVIPRLASGLIAAKEIPYVEARAVD